MAQKTIWKRKKERPALFFRLIAPLFTISLLLYLFGHIPYFIVRNNRLAADGILTKGVVIDDKNYWGNSPVSHTFSYSYSFEVDGKEYIGDTRDPKMQPGQIVEVKYVPAYPSFNEVVKAK